MAWNYSLNEAYTSLTEGNFGRELSHTGYWYDGKISNARIYSDAKDQTFVDELYAEGYYTA